MDKKILQSLNKSQQDAVKQIDGAVLILAGAGSGKTKTITHRVAYLISLGIDPASILTLTFTNKASNEMRQRAMKLISNEIYPPLLCTFHKFGLLFLKFHISKLNRKNNFSIIDSDDRKRIIKTIDKTIPVSQISSEISTYKNSIITPEVAKNNAKITLYRQIANIYEKYENYLLTNNLVDFDDLLLLPYLILKNNDDIRKQTSQKYQYIMVDEYQDTNKLQYKLLKQLCSTHQNLCVVGDDDQSIYGWRGATISNILNFEKQFVNTKVVKLENNYRSTNKILKCANNLIEHNRKRIGKKLIGTRCEGENIKIYESRDENRESAKIVDDIKKLVLQGESLNDIAILFRINALSRAIEDGFVKNNINYHLIGGIKFYERAEIKDIISYMRIITNFNDDFSFKRVVNRPKRGIGKITIDKLELYSVQNSQTMIGVIEKLSPEQLSQIVGKKNSRTLKVFVASLLDLRDVLTDEPNKFIDIFEDTFDFKDFYKNMQDGDDRIANIDEFYGLIRDFFIKNSKLGLKDFLNEISLESSQDEIQSAQKISLMSIHTSKGLEYKYIFIIGLEEGFFPITGENSDIEEERRLGYVAFTRAKDSLTLSFAHSRFYKGKRTNLLKSRFLSESRLIKGSLTMEKKSDWAIGDLIKHKIFGMGRIEAIQKTGSDYKLKINFGGSKRDILSPFVQKI